MQQNPKSVATYESLLEISHDAAGVIFEGIVVVANAEARRFGIDVGTKLKDVVISLDLEQLALDTMLPISAPVEGLKVGWLEWRIRRINDLVLFSAKDITVQRNTEAQVEDQLNAIRIGAEEVEQFAYAASHDIQEPLRTITNYAEFLQEDAGATLSSECRSYIQHIVASAKHCRELVRALLVYSRVGKERNFALHSVFDTVLEALGANEFGLLESKLVLELEDLPNTVWCDKALLVSVFSNLIGNAVKFSPQGSILTIGGKDLETHSEFWVKDTGYGFEQQHAENIFNVFHRLDRSKDGVGIGLASSKKAVAIHEGQIWAQSSPGLGSSFFFTVARNHDEEAIAGRRSCARCAGSSPSSSECCHDSRPDGC